MPVASKPKTISFTKSNMQALFTKASHILEGEKKREKELKSLNWKKKKTWQLNSASIMEPNVVKTPLITHSKTQVALAKNENYWPL